MNQMNKETAKTANQAWRKKPRKFAPKSRLGCKTCKIRRIKCDLSQPSCVKCQSTGRTCDGYSEIPPTLNRRVDTAESHKSHQPCTTISTHQPEQWHMQNGDLILQNPGPLMILPVAGSAQAEAMCFFEYVSIKNLNEYRPCQSWRDTLMYFSQTVPSVRDAAIALALVHRNYLDCKDRVPDKTPLLYYNRAIQLLLSQKAGDSTEMTAITLLVCYLFTCFDHLAGNYVQAMKHLRGGVELSRSIDKAILDDNNIFVNSKASGARTLIRQVMRQIRRLDMQAVTFLVDWTPVNIQEALISQSLPSDGAFRSLDQAADHLQVLVAQVMGLRNANPGEMPALPSSHIDIVLGRLERWLRLFENMLQQGSSYDTDSKAYPLISLLRLQHTIALTFLSSHGPGREMEYDNFLPRFQECIALVGSVTAAQERYSGSVKPTFTPEIGILPVLYIIGMKCRHPVVRRQVLNILRRRRIREAVWDSISAAKVIERVIEIEEGGSEVEMTRGMENILLWQRVETMSWLQVVSGQSITRVDIKYTFCAQEGTHTESLMI